MTIVLSSGAKIISETTVRCSSAFAGIFANQPMVQNVKGLRRISGKGSVMGCGGFGRGRRMMSASSSSIPHAQWGGGVVQLRQEDLPRRSLGQPSPFTHPHWMDQHHVTPGVSRGEYSDRRQRLVELFRNDMQGGNIFQRDSRPVLFLLKAPSLHFSAPDVPYPFRQDSNFYYLTGLTEPCNDLLTASLAIYNTHDNPSVAKSALFVSRRDAHDELWNGPSPGTDGAAALTGVDYVAEHSELQSFLHQFQKRETTVVCDPEQFKDTLPEILNNPKSSSAPLKFSGENVIKLIHKLRWVKSDAEMKLMRSAGWIGAEGFADTIAFAKPGMVEYALGSKMELECRMRGAQCLAYPPVIAGGNRANTIHYLINNQTLTKDDMVLMDSGCDFHGYVSDITRSWPLSGKYEGKRKEAYEALLEVHDDLLQFVNERRPLRLSEVHFHMLTLLSQQLVRLKILPSSLSDQDLIREVDKFCPHHVSHYLGLDVHDTATVPRNIDTKPGVCITVEPGLYFPEANMKIPAEFRGFGMRIEDDVLLTETGAEVLTNACPKTVSEIEALCGIR